MSRSAAAVGTDVALARAAGVLAAGGPAALDTVLHLARDVIGCAALVLHTADRSTVLATAERSLSAVVPVQAMPRGVALEVPVRARGQLLGVLTATSARPLTPRQAGDLGGFADLVALFRLGTADERVAAGQAVLDDEADRAQVAATLYEGAGDALVTVRYTADLVMAGRLGPDAIDEPVRAALAALRYAYRDLRAHALEAGLRAALHDMAARLGGDRLSDGLPEIRLRVRADDPRLDLLPPPVAVTVQRVAEAALRGAIGPAEIRAAYDGQMVKLSVESAEIAYDASELSRWTRRAAALGGDLLLRPAGVELSLPAELGTGPDEPRKGHDDDRSDL